MGAFFENIITGVDGGTRDRHDLRAHRARDRAHLQVAEGHQLRPGGVRDLRGLHALRVPALLELPYALSAVLAVSATVVLSILVERSSSVRCGGAPTSPCSSPRPVWRCSSSAHLCRRRREHRRRVARCSRARAAACGRRRILVGLVSPQRLIVLSLVLVSAASLALFFSRTTLGKGILAMSAEPFAVRLAGISTEKMSMLIWGIAGRSPGLAGVAFVPTSALTPGCSPASRSSPRSPPW
jgi:ABC-type branched-subunit amino acid transport system permease subunit